MTWKLNDFSCNLCNHEFEELWKEGEDVACPNCGSLEIEKQLAIPRSNTMNLLSKEEYATKMKDRSRKHTEAMTKREGFALQNGKTWGGKY